MEFWRGNNMYHRCVIITFDERFVHHISIVFSFVFRDVSIPEVSVQIIKGA